MTTENDDSTQEKSALHLLIATRHGTPYEDDGTCEMCNANGPTWNAEEPITLNRVPLCAACIAAAEAAVLARMAALREQWEQRLMEMCGPTKDAMECGQVLQFRQCLDELRSAIDGAPAEP